MIQKKFQTEGLKDGWADRQALFYRTLPAIARAPTRTFDLDKKKNKIRIGFV